MRPLKRAVIELAIGERRVGTACSLATGVSQRGCCSNTIPAGVPRFPSYFPYSVIDFLPWNYTFHPNNTPPASPLEAHMVGFSLSGIAILARNPFTKPALGLEELAILLEHIPPASNRGIPKGLRMSESGALIPFGRTG
jgi:hypothetical protein